MKIVLTGKPESTGHIYKSTCRGGRPCVYMSPEGKALKEQYQWMAKSQWHEPIIEGPIKITIELFFNNHLRRDIDNWHKISLDALTGIVYKDDSQIQEMVVKKGIDASDPRIEIKVEKIDCA